MPKLHRLLKRQMKKYLGTEEVPEEISQFVSAVNYAYVQFENDRALMERSIEISSREYAESIQKTKKIQAQLVHQEKMAGIGQISAGIAHEINNPLGFVQSNIETLGNYLNKIITLQSLEYALQECFQSNELEEYQQKSLEIQEYKKKNKIDFIYADIKDIVSECKQGLNRIEKIVKSLLGFARKAASAEFGEYDLNKGIADTLTIANNEIKYYAKVIEELEPLPTIYAIDGEINQVLLNIIINAAYAIKEKGEAGTIKIQTYFSEDQIFCKISDDGIGISQENLNNIFNPFFTTKPVGEGTGLGLSIAHDIIVNKHGGKIEVTSEEGVGTTFLITLSRGKKGDEV